MAKNVYIPANSKEIRDQWLADVELSARLEGIVEPPIHPGTDLYLRGDATAKMAMLCYASVAQRDASRRVNDADFDDLNVMREERGLPVVKPSPSGGGIIVSILSGLVTIADNTQLLWPNNKRGRVLGTHIKVANGDSVRVVSIDTGEDMNLEAGETIRFVNPPTNVEVKATVDPLNPITGGTGAETESRLRYRILNHDRNSPKGGNWAECNEQALNASAAAEAAFTYPALGGPGSLKLVIVKAAVFNADPSLESFSRVAPSTAITSVRGALFSWFGAHSKVVVGDTVDVSADCAMTVSIPNSEVDGGDGTGWVDSTPWPQLVNLNERRVYVTHVFSANSIRVSALTTLEPEIGNTIAWWSPNERRFLMTTINAVSGATGAWDIILDDVLIDALGYTVGVGDFISPGAVNTVSYGESWRTALAKHGPGEATDDDNRLPASLRRPQPGEATGGQLWPYRIGAIELCTVKDSHSEMIDATWSYRDPIEAVAPSQVSGRPQVLIPRHFGVYKKGWWE